MRYTSKPSFVKFQHLWKGLAYQFQQGQICLQRTVLGKPRRPLAAQHLVHMLAGVILAIGRVQKIPFEMHLLLKLDRADQQLLPSLLLRGWRLGG